MEALIIIAGLFAAIAMAWEVHRHKDDIALLAAQASWLERVQPERAASWLELLCIGAISGGFTFLILTI